jgi:glycosyltransferase involved in cell wall biosynthesis
MINNLAQRLPTHQFLLIGGEPKDVLRVQALVDRLKDRNLIVTGFVQNAKLPLYQAACDVLLMPYQVKVSASSGGDIGKYLSPMKLFEYMASERVILSSDLPVLREVLSPENAILLPPDDIEAWYKAIVYIKNHPDLAKKLSTQARRDVEKYTWDVRVKCIFEDLSNEI